MTENDDRQISFLQQQQLYLRRAISHFTNPKVFLYTGQNRSEVPDGVVHVKVDSSVKSIRWDAFSGCKDMVTIEFNDGLERIEGRAFVDCHSLRNPQIPPTVREIGDLAFSTCLALCSLDLPEGLETIGRAVFPSCSFRNVRIPSTMDTVGEKVFSCCTDMVSVEIPDGVTTIGDEAFFQCLELRNIAIPATVTTIGDNAFEYCFKLQDKYPDPYDLIEALKSRFDVKPVHKLCYYQSHYSLDNTLSILKIAMKADKSESRQDVLGMTPLHILSLSKKQDLEFHKKLVKKHPKDLLIKDEWGCIPVYYACLCDASLEIVQFLLKAHRSLFSEEKLTWDKIIDNFSIMFVSTEVLRYVVMWSVAPRLDVLNHDPWCIDVLREIQNVPEGGRKNWKEKESQIRKVHRKVAKYELRELSSLLELAAWKAKLDSSLAVAATTSSSTGTSKEKKNGGGEEEEEDAELNYAVLRQNCRIQCGAEHMIPNILSFVDTIF